MDGLLKAVENMEEVGGEFSFKKYFVHLTTRKAVIWIIIVGLIVHFNTLLNGFVWDDFGLIFRNPDILSFNLLQAFSHNHVSNGGFYRPIHTLYFSFLYLLFHNISFFYHFIQLTIHIVDSCLLFIFLKKFFGERISFILALLFLVHPINVESTAFISATTTPISTFFGLSALILIQRKVITKTTLIAISLLFLLSILSKEEGILFMIMALFYCFFYKKSYFLKVFPCVLISLIIYSLLRFTIGGAFIPPQVGYSSAVDAQFLPIQDATLPERLLTMPQIILYYTQTFFYPADLSVNQLWITSQINFGAFYFPLFVVLTFFIIVLLFSFYLRTKHKELLAHYYFFLFWFVLGLGMHLQIIPLEMTVADRWAYFFIIGLLGMIGVSIKVASLSKRSKTLLVVAIITILVLLSARTIMRNSNWVNDITLFAHDSTVKDNYAIELNLGSDYMQAHDIRALKHLQESVRLHPYAINLYNLGVANEALGNIKEAEKLYLEAYSIHSPSYHTTQHVLPIYERLAYILLLKEKSIQAASVAKTGLTYYPNSSNLWFFLAASEYRQHHQQNALQAIKKAKTLHPSQEYDTLESIIINKQPLTSIP
jgi:Tfp pilus assembly protein PilF